MKSKHLSLLLLGFAIGMPAAAQVQFNLTPSRVLGQTNLTSSAVNLVEGRELNGPLGVALDTSVTPAIVYVADTSNNRVLAWKNADAFNNGAMADAVIGQRDLGSTLPLGPGTSFNNGLNHPSSIAVDAQGNLFVADSGNNRLLRYPKPLDSIAQPDPVKVADLVLGQDNFTSRNRNKGLSTPSQNTIATNNDNSVACGQCFATGLAFDSQGNLWFTDAGNSRVLHYPASVVRGSSNGAAADIVLGQDDFSTIVLPDFTLRAGKQYLRFPGGVAVDATGNIYVSDDLNRVAFYAWPVVAAKHADRLLGVVPTGGVNDTNIGGNFSGGVRGVFCSGNIAFISDSANNRVLRYDTPDQWSAESAAAPSPAAKAVIGQDGFTSNGPNRAIGAEPNASGFAGPGLAAVNSKTGEFFITDIGNNRVLVFPDLTTGPAAVTAGPPYQANRVLGQDFFYGRAANLIEGREFYTFVEGIPTSGYGVPVGANMAIDSTSTPPRLYVADPGNNRVLAWADARSIHNGDKADLVIGQVDFSRNLANSPNNDSTKPNDTGLYVPTGVAVDSDGNLWVADRGNGRVLRFPTPFEQDGVRHADIVIGQASFTTYNPDPSARNMAAPHGLAFSVDGHLLVSDALHHRVLLFNKPFSTGMAATKVFGQPDFNSSTAGSGPSNLRSPRDLAVDIDDRLYVTDPGNLRVVVYPRLTDPGNNPNAASTVPIGGVPSGIDVRRDTNEIWIGDSSNQRAIRFDSYDAIFTSPNPTYVLPVGNVVSLRTDQFNDLLVADYASRVVIRFPTFAVTNSASGFVRIAPAMIATLYLQAAAQAAVTTPVVKNLPWETTLADIQVLVGGTPAPIYYVYPRQIAVQIPSSTVVGSDAEFLVLRPSTGQILAATTVRIEAASPAFFTSNQAGTGPIAALVNRDGKTSINSKTNPSNRGEIVSLYLTGYGNIPGLPPDGHPAPGVASTPDSAQLLVAVGGSVAKVNYSGVAPGYAGLWQINAVIPNDALVCATPPCDTPVAVRYRDIFSNQNPANPTVRIITTISVK